MNISAKEVASLLIPIGVIGILFACVMIGDANRNDFEYAVRHEDDRLVLDWVDRHEPNSLYETSRRQLKETPLHTVLAYGKCRYVKHLLTHGADPYVLNSESITPAMLLGCSGDGSPQHIESMVRDFELAGFQICAPCGGPNSETLLHIAAGCHCPEYVRYILDRGCDVESKDWEGRTPLHYCLERTSFLIASPTLEVLLRRGGRLETEDVNGVSPIDLARNSGFGGELAELRDRCFTGVRED